MNFQPHDIITKHHTVWLSQRLVMAVCGISDEYIWKTRTIFKQSVQPCHRHHAVLPDTGKSWRWAKMNHGFYYDLSRIPNRAPTFYRELFGDAEQLVQQYEEYLKSKDGKLLDTRFKNAIQMLFKSYLNDYSSCTITQRTALAKACAVLEFSANYITENTPTGDQIYKDLAGLIEKHDLRYLPQNYRKFKEKVQDALSGQSIENIIQLPRSGNSNALIYDNPWLSSIALKLRASGHNYTNDFISRKITDLCHLKGIPAPSRRWFGQNVYETNETKFLTDLPRFGKGSKFAHANTGYIPLEDAIFAGDCWMIDASRVNIVSHDTGKRNADGKKIEKFLFYCLIFDAYSGAVLGYSMDYSENRQMVINALKMAAENSGYLPYQMIFDRFPGHNTQEIKNLVTHLEFKGVRIDFAHTAEAKAKLERTFGSIQNVVMPDSKYFYGEGIRSTRKTARKNPETMALIRKEAAKDGFDLSGAYEEAFQILESWNNMPYSYYSRKRSKVNESPRLLHAQSEKPHVIWIEECDQYMLFGTQKRSVTIKNNGQIRTEIMGAEYIYLVDDYEIMKREKSVVLSYNVEDLSKVYLYKTDGEILMPLCKAEAFSKPQMYGPHAEYGKLAKAKARQKRIEEMRSADLENAIALAANDIDLVMGRLTKKESAEEAETALLMQEANNYTPVKTNKKANKQKSIGLIATEFVTSNL